MNRLASSRPVFPHPPPNNRSRVEISGFDWHRSPGRQAGLLRRCAICVRECGVSAFILWGLNVLCAACVRPAGSWACCRAQHTRRRMQAGRRAEAPTSPGDLERPGRQGKLWNWIMRFATKVSPRACVRCASGDRRENNGFSRFSFYSQRLQRSRGAGWCKRAAVPGCLRMIRVWLPSPGLFLLPSSRPALPRS